MLELVLRAVPLQRGLVSESISYVVSLTFGDIARLLEEGHLYVPNDPDLADFAQRKPNPTRIKAIAQYILETYQDGTTFFPPICINVQPPPVYREGSVVLPYSSVTLRLTDGQHRCCGIRQALQDIQAEQIGNAITLSQLEIGALLYGGLSLEEERQAFRDQNLLVQRPSVTLSHTFDQRSPVVLMAKDLMKRVPQFRQNIETVDNSLGQHNPKLATLSTLVTATRYMFPHLKSKKDVDAKIDWAATFWAAAASALPDNPWQVQNKGDRNQQRKESVAVTAVAIQALGILGRDFYQEGIPAEDLMRWLLRLGAIDWNKENQLWHSRGVTQVGPSGNLTVSNTKTTVECCYKILHEYVGTTPVDGVI